LLGVGLNAWAGWWQADPVAGLVRAGSRRWWAVGALALALLVVGLDMTVLNLALPTLSVSLHASTAQLQWIIDAYMLVTAAALLPGGLLGDRLGRKKVLLVSLVIFGGASAWCAFSVSAGELIAARALLGLGAAALLPLSLSVLPVMFAEEERPKAVAALMVTTVVAYPIGPILGGWLLTHFWWGSVFLINLPVSVLALAAVALFLPESRSAARPRVDAGGIALSSAGLAALTYGLIDAGQHGWGSPRALAVIAAGTVLLVVFVAWERRVRRGGQPLVDLSLFGSADFTWGTILATVVSFAMFGLIFATPQYFQAVLGTTPLGAGVRLLPLIAGLLAGAGAGDKLVKMAGANSVVAAGFALISAGLITGTFTTAASGYGFAVVWIAILGAGLGLALPTAMDAAIGQLSAERSGVGSAVIAAVRTVGATLGVAVLGSLLSTAYSSRLPLPRMPAAAADVIRSSVMAGVAVAHKLGSPLLLGMVRSAFVHGMDVLLWACGGIGLAGIALALIFLPRRLAAADEHQPPAVATAPAGAAGTAVRSGT
jgi:DHA2 family multidrug resistance protein-like MFS transporter